MIWCLLGVCTKDLARTSGRWHSVLLSGFGEWCFDQPLCLLTCMKNLSIYYNSMRCLLLLGQDCLQDFVPCIYGHLIRGQEQLDSTHIHHQHHTEPSAQMNLYLQCLCYNTLTQTIGKKELSGDLLQWSQGDNFVICTLHGKEQMRIIHRFHREMPWRSEKRTQNTNFQMCLGI